MGTSTLRICLANASSALHYCRDIRKSHVFSLSILTLADNRVSVQKSKDALGSYTEARMHASYHATRPCLFQCW
jgi:hypothetical protein